jgi:hypothetical protein
MYFNEICSSYVTVFTTNLHFFKRPYKVRSEFNESLDCNGRISTKLEVPPHHSFNINSQYKI